MLVGDEDCSFREIVPLLADGCETTRGVAGVDSLEAYSTCVEPITTPVVETDITPLAIPVKPLGLSNDTSKISGSYDSSIPLALSEPRVSWSLLFFPDARDEILASQFPVDCM